MFGSERSRYLQLILDSTPDGITVQRPDGSLLYANASAAKLVGFNSPEELVNTAVGEVVSRFEMYDEEGEPFPPERLPGRMALQGKEPEDALIRFRRLADDTIDWSIVGARPVFDEGDQGSRGELLFVVNTFRYVTDYMRALHAEQESRQRAEEAERRLSFLARSSEILAESLDYGVTLRRISQLAVPDIADWCAVDLHFDELERVSVAHVDPHKVELAYEIQRRYPPHENAEAGLYKVLRTGEPEIYEEITDEMLVQRATDDEQLRLLRQLNLRSVLIVPLTAHERVLGAITLVGAESGRRFAEKDIQLATELAQRAAMAVENARLYDEAQRLNEQLEQRVARRTAALRETNRRLQQKVEEIQEAEERLRRSEMQLAEAQAIANLGSWEWDIVQDTFSWSRAMYRVFGLDPKETTPSYREFLARVHPKDRARVIEALRAARDRAIPFSLHHRIVLEDGAEDSGRSVRIMLAQGTVETDDDGNVLRIVGTSQDVTMQKEIEEDLRRSEALYRAMADSLPNGSVLVVDKDLRYRLARGPGLNISNLASWEGKSVIEVAEEEWRERAIVRYKRALAGQSTTQEVQRAGCTYFVQTVPLANDEEEPYAALTLVQDVTRQREAEETTRRLLELSRNLNATLDIDALVGTVVDSAVKLTKADRGRLMTDGRPRTVDRGRDADFYALEAPIVNLNGEMLGYLQVGRQQERAPFSNTDREKLDGLAQIAAIALQNALSFEHLRELGQKLVSAQEEERRSLSRELHDSTGQVLMALKMSVSMLREQVQEQVSHRTESEIPASGPAMEEGDLLEQLEEIGEMVESIYEEIRAVSHALRPPSLDVTSIDEALAGLCEDYARHSGLQIAYEGCEPPNLPDNVSISLYRMLQEALTNVAKHAQADRVEVTFSDVHNQIELSVRDNGVGFGVTEVLQRQGAGGVGLIGLRERFELLGGALHIESSPGSGTRIAGVFYLENIG